MKTLMGLFAITTMGCIGNLDEARARSREVHDIVEGASGPVHDLCTAPAEEYAETYLVMYKTDAHAAEKYAAEKRATLDARKCQKVWSAYDVARTASISLDAVIAAIASGQCVGVSHSVDKCNAAGAVVNALIASAEVAETLRGLKR